jgi:hypothetical protein
MLGGEAEDREIYEEGEEEEKSSYLRDKLG